MAKVEFNLNDLQLRGNLAELGPKINKYLTVTTDFGATDGVKEMKTKAPWTDRTTNARSGLWTKPNHSGSGPIGFAQHEIVFGHAVNYGIWLEIKDPNKGGRPIVMPTTIATGKAVMNTLRGIFANLDSPKAPKVQVPNAAAASPRSSAGARQRAEARARAARGSRTSRTGRTRRT
jgi:hypothetical protein